TNRRTNRPPKVNPQPRPLAAFMRLDFERTLVPSVVSEPHAKHLTQPHQDANRSLQNRRFQGKFSVLVRPGEVQSLTLNQRAPRSDQSQVRSLCRRYCLLVIPHGDKVESRTVRPRRGGEPEAFAGCGRHPIPRIGLANVENQKEPKQSRILGEQILSSTDAFIGTE